MILPVPRPKMSSLQWKLRLVLAGTMAAAHMSSSMTIIDPIPSFQPVRINCGSADPFTDNDGNVWGPDEFFVGGSAYLQCPNEALVAHTDMPQLYCGNRWFDTATGSYEIPVNMPGTYQVTLHFADVYFNATGMRVFDVALEGSVVESNFDIVAKAGGSSVPVAMTYDVEVKDQMLTIDVIKKTENPMFSGIQVLISPKDNSNGYPYVPGNLIVLQHGLLLSEGLSARLLATSTENVELLNGTFSSEVFHTRPDGAACFADTNPANPGGWMYVSNSEAKPLHDDSEEKPGGVGAFYFNAQGQVIDYRMILNNTRANCGGGTTPWGAWISGEEYHSGQVWQVDPMGVRPAQRITLGMDSPGMFESFAHDLRDPLLPHFFMSKDDAWGELTRFSVPNPDWDNPWEILTGNGNLDYLVVEPYPNASNHGTFFWEPNKPTAQQSSRAYFPNVEGIDCKDNQLYFVSKEYKTVFVLDLDAGTYKNYSTATSLFDGEPDQIHRSTPNADDPDADRMLYFTEDGDNKGTKAGIHGRNTAGQYFTILESHVYSDETTGLAFSPDNHHMYVAYQDTGLLFDITRDDGKQFSANALYIKHHRGGGRVGSE